MTKIDFYQASKGLVKPPSWMHPSKNKTRVSAYAKEWQKNNPEKIKAVREKPSTKHMAFVYRLKKHYNLSHEEYLSLIEKQQNMCAICGCSPKERHPGKLCIDHDHKTGEVRGLLCTQCNIAIGLFKDDPKLLKAAIKYLLIHSLPIDKN